jgi:hypothetical protein
MTLTQEQKSQIISAVIVLVISLLSVFGYDVAVIAPRDVSHTEVQQALADFPR